ncbi:MAG TPA: hypothetical protein PKH07_08165, partial [bacterium]|nr:hypothetical protein [bacterium]
SVDEVCSMTISGSLAQSLACAVLCSLYLMIYPVCARAQESSSEWTERLLPLPKKISINGSATVPAGRMLVTMPEGQSPVLQTAKGILKPFNTGSNGFEIRMVLTSDSDPSCPRSVLESLARVPNSDQAYAIEPQEHDGRFDGLLLVANTPVGLLYAARTLSQMLPTEDQIGESVVFPGASVLDWPDLAERGQWGGNCTSDLPWLSERKMNVVEVHANLGFDEQHHPTASLDQKTLDTAKRLGIKVVPIIMHLEQLAPTQMFQFFPELAATPDPHTSLPTDFKPAVCFSQPKATEILSQWMKQILSTGEVTEIMVWLSEDAAPCFCTSCAGKEPYVREVECIQNAFSQARMTRSDGALRLLTSQGSYPVNDRIIEVLNTDTKLSFYDGSKTYDSSHKPMIIHLLEQFSASGRWLGVYPQLTNSWRSVFPFTGPQFIHTRMKEFADKKLHCLIGYATPSNRFYEFNVTAAAEWSWNSKGRTPTEFAEVYARRKGVSNPDRFAEWAQIVGTVGWDIAGSRVLLTLLYNPTMPVIPKDGKKSENILETIPDMVFGQGLLGEFPTKEHFEEDIVLAERALHLARIEKSAEMIEESLSVLNTLRFLQGLKQMADAKTLSEEEALQAFVQGTAQVREAARQVTGALYRWGAIVNPGALPSRYRDTVNVFSKTAAAATALSSSLGIEDPSPEYSPRLIQEWKSEDFRNNPEAVLWADISDFVTSDGQFDVTFQFTSGAVGLEILSVALLKGASQEGATVFDETRSTFHVGKNDSWTEYWMQVPKDVFRTKTSEERLFLKCEVRGPALDLPSNRRTTKGQILIRKSWRDSTP